MVRDVLFAGEEDIKRTRNDHRIGLYFTFPILLLIALWSMLSQSRWMIFDSGVGTRFHFDFWMIFGVVLVAIMIGIAFFTLGNVTRGLKKECKLINGAINLEEGHIVMIWSIIIGFVLGMGFWDIVTIVHLAIDFGILNIWNINVTVFDFGFWQMNISVLGLVFIGVVKMGAVLILYVLALKNIRRGSVCNLANLDVNAIMN